MTKQTSAFRDYANAPSKVPTAETIAVSFQGRCTGAMYVTRLHGKRWRVSSLTANRVPLLNLGFGFFVFCLKYENVVLDLQPIAATTTRAPCLSFTFLPYVIRH